MMYILCTYTMLIYRHTNIIKMCYLRGELLQKIVWNWRFLSSVYIRENDFQVEIAGKEIWIHLYWLYVPAFLNILIARGTTMLSKLVLIACRLYHIPLVQFLSLSYCNCLLLLFPKMVNRPVILDNGNKEYAATQWVPNIHKSRGWDRGHCDRNSYSGLMRIGNVALPQQW